jgi:hypothetical protein
LPACAYKNRTHEAMRVKATIPSKLNLIMVQAEAEKIEKRTYISNAVPSNAVAANKSPRQD